jgi:hypothetical protein
VLVSVVLVDARQRHGRMIDPHPVGQRRDVDVVTSLIAAKTRNALIRKISSGVGTVMDSPDES